MIQRPIGLNHGEHCDSGDWEWMCDECREGVDHDLDIVREALREQGFTA